MTNKLLCGIIASFSEGGLVVITNTSNLAADRALAYEAIEKQPETEEIAASDEQETEAKQPGNIGETLTGLAEVIHGRRDASPKESYTTRLLTDVEDELLKKLAEEASEVIMACKDNDHDHIRYEAGDLVYHLLVTLERYGITLDELAGELNARRH